MTQSSETDRQDLSYNADDKAYWTDDRAPGSAGESAERDLEKQHDHDVAQEVEATKSTEEQDPDIVDYDGPDDPENPLNWTKKKKWINGSLLSLFTLITPLASSMFAPAVPDVMADFHSTNATIGTLVVSIYILGYCFGPLFIAPLSEIYGRSPVYHATNVMFVIFTICCAVSKSLGMLIAFRFLAGAMGSTPLTIGGGTMSDMFKTEERGAAMAIWSIGPLLGPVIGPIAGSYLGEAKGWRWDFWLLAILSAATTICMMIFLRETYAPAILAHKTKRLRKETGNSNLRSKLDSGLAPRELLTRSLIRPLKMLLYSPIVLLLSLYMAVVYGYLYLLFTTMTDVFESTYHFSPSNVGLSYLGLGIGMFGGLFLTGFFSDRIVKKLAAKNNGVMEPEFRLPPMIPASFAIPFGLFLYGWTAKYAVHYIVPIIGTSFVGLGLITTFMPIMTYLIDAFTIHSASVIAANTVLRSLLGALLPLAGPKMYAALGLGWGNSLLGFIALALIPLPVVFYKYGKRIRAKFAIEF